MATRKKPRVPAVPVEAEKVNESETSAPEVKMSNKIEMIAAIEREIQTRKGKTQVRVFPYLIPVDPVKTLRFKAKGAKDFILVIDIQGAALKKNKRVMLSGRWQ